MWQVKGLGVAGQGFGSGQGFSRGRSGVWRWQVWVWQVKGLGVAGQGQALTVRNMASEEPGRETSQS